MALAKIRLKLRLLASIALLLGLTFTAGQTQAQWPPFSFQLIPRHVAGQITYEVRFEIAKEVTWPITDIRLNIPLPEGTRFIEARADWPTETSFDGAEIYFFTPKLAKKTLNNAAFTVEVVDPTKKVYAAHAWISWGGDQPGNYLAEAVSIDISRQTLTWAKPARSRLELKARAIAANNVITYLIYLRNVSKRMWDVRIGLPIPAGTTVLSAAAPSPFVVGVGAQEVSFSALELASWVDLDPLKVQVSTAGLTDSTVSTRVWASWKNVGRKVGITIPPEEAITTAEVVLQPQSSQSVVLDVAGDVPFSNYDVTSLALQEVLLPGNVPALKIIFYAAGALGPQEEPLEYAFYFDTDCQIDTGDRERYLGAEYRIRYNHQKGRAELTTWDTNKWQASGPIPFAAPAEGRTVTVWAARDLLRNSQQFCWLAKVKYKGGQFNPSPPTEFVPDTRDPRLMYYELTAEASKIESDLPAQAENKSAKPIENERQSSQTQPGMRSLITMGDVWRYLPGWSEPPDIWKQSGFDDSDWFAGPTSIGYGAGIYTTDLRLATPDAFAGDAPAMIQYTDPDSGMIIAVPATEPTRSLFMRRTFTITDPTVLGQLSLEAAYRDGFVAYLNGVEVARRGLGKPKSPVSHDTMASKPNSTAEASSIDLSGYIDELAPGANVLAVQVHRAKDSADLAMDLALKALSVAPQPLSETRSLPVEP